MILAIGMVAVFIIVALLVRSHEVSETEEKQRKKAEKTLKQ